MKLDKNKVAYWYKHGLWTAEMVLNAVAKGKLTDEEAKEIFAEPQKTAE